MNERQNAWSLVLQNPFTKDRANAWKTFLLSFLVTGGSLCGCMCLIYWLVS